MLVLTLAGVVFCLLAFYDRLAIVSHSHVFPFGILFPGFARCVFSHTAQLVGRCLPKSLSGCSLCPMRAPVCPLARRVVPPSPLTLVVVLHSQGGTVAFASFALPLTQRAAAS